MHHNPGIQIYQLVQCQVCQHLHSITPQRHPRKTCP
jgi:hypothetical protein